MKTKKELAVWITREFLNSCDPHHKTKACRYLVWIGGPPKKADVVDRFWTSGHEGPCEYVTNLCFDLGAKAMRKLGISLRPGGGPVECVLRLK